MLSSIGPAALVILAVNIGLGLLGLFAIPQIIERCLFRPYEFARGMRRATIITSAFVHADLAHLAFNMITFWFFGVMLEYQIGTLKFVLLYAIGLVASSVGSYFKHRNNPEYATLGAGPQDRTAGASITMRIWVVRSVVWPSSPLSIPAPGCGPST
jgi:membrane associated rhomboid family serine protease